MKKIELDKYPGYLIYRDGRVWSCKSGRFLRPHRNYNGYTYFKLSIGGLGKNVSQHRLLAEAFIPNPKGKEGVHHKNHIKDDNRLSNLMWVTHRENMRFAAEAGRMVSGGALRGVSWSDDRVRPVHLRVSSCHGKTKLSGFQVGQIREYYATGSYSMSFLAGVFGVTTSLVSQIVSGKRRCFSASALYVDLMSNL